MDKEAYQKPREKLRQRGVSFLTTSELLQVVIGSGVKGASSARLAREVMVCMRRGMFTYDHLMDISGLGHAKVCQIIAAVELGTRYAKKGDAMGGKSLVRSLDLHTLHQRCLEKGRMQVSCFWFDGSGLEVGVTSYKREGDGYSAEFVRRIIADAITMSAHAFIVYTPSASSVSPSAKDLLLIRRLQEASRFLHVSLVEAVGFTKSHYSQWLKEVPP